MPTLALALVLAGCATSPPVPSPPVAAQVAAGPLLRLSPASLGHAMSARQQLEFTVGEQHQVVDALLEVDADALRLALLVAGQTALRLHWDGQVLEESRAPWLPAELSAERVLSDLQLVHWPADEIRRNLPTGWSLRENKVSRQLLQGDEVVVDIRFPAFGVVELQQHRVHYRLTLRSADAAGESP